MFNCNKSAFYSKLNTSQDVFGLGHSIQNRPESRGPSHDITPQMRLIDNFECKILSQYVLISVQC